MKIAKLLYLFGIACVTTLNAQNWQKIEMNFPPCDTIRNTRTITFITRNTGWIFISEDIDTILSPIQYLTKIFKTSDGGKNWFMQKYFTDTFYAGKLFTTDSLHCWALSLDGKLIFTTNGGTNWDETYIAGTPTIYPYYFYNLYFFNNVEGIVMDPFRPWSTNDGGRSWTAGDSSKVYFYDGDISFINRRKGWLVAGSTLYRTDGGYIANTTDGGKTWAYQDSATYEVFGVDFVDSLHGFVTGDRACISSTTDGGKNWQDSHLLYFGAFRDIGFIDDKYGWITGDDGKILNTTDRGITWEIQEQGMQYDLRKLIVLKKEKVAYVFGDSDNRPPFILLFADLSDVTGVLANEKNIPKEFQLMQNYPNPFNPITSIKYKLPKSSFVKLTVYDLLGREIEVLVNEEKEAGDYNVNWNAARISSGLYIAKLETGSFTAFIKMVLLK